MNLETNYMGLKLPHPFLPGASPLVEDVDDALRMEDAGAPVIALNSLFEEEITQEELGILRHVDLIGESYAEASSFLPPIPDEVFGTEEYLSKVQRIKERVGVPVIASLNGTTSGGWLRCATEIEQAGADALELNVYEMATDASESGPEVENRTLGILREIKSTLSIPVAIKLSPFYSSLSHFAMQLERTGVDGLVLFNRFYQADIDPEELEVRREIRLSDSSELLLRLRWIAILSGQMKTPIALSGGVHTPLDAVKAFMSGAQVVQVVAALLRNGLGYLGTLRAGFEAWMEEHGYDSLKSMRGCMNLSRCPDPKAYERTNYIQILQSW